MRQRIISLFTLENLKYFLLFAILLRYNVFYFAPEGFKFAKLTVAVIHSIGLAWGAALLLLGYLKKKPLVMLKPILPLVLFLLSYLLTIINTEFGSLSQLPGFFSYILYFFVLASYDSDESENNIFRQMKIFNKLFIVATFLITTASIVFFFLGSDIRFSPSVTIGTLGGRFAGITGNANKDAILAALSIFCCFFNYFQYQLTSRTKVFYAINIITQIFLLAIGFSRGAVLLVTMMILLFAAIWTREQVLSKQSKNKILKVPLMALTSIAAFLLLTKGMQVGLILVKHEEISTQEATNVEPGKLGRAASSELSSGRLELWKTCSKVVFQYPLGVGFSNIKDACQKITPSYNNDLNSMHNTFLQALVGSGFFGLLMTLVFTFLLMFKLCKTLLDISSYKSSQRHMIYFCSTLLIALVAYSTYDNGPFFTHNIPNLFFWVYLGYFCYFMNSRAKTNV